ncbi:FAD/NAD(P)-binding protein [Nocardiopsis mangrovi]|uniref:FAD/NAD(P)-binding protein n=1 Tax=Nocardiopsis mangrovi TaxID=1179818 RepID=A0ABV9E4A0_9ACTN
MHDIPPSPESPDARPGTRARRAPGLSVAIVGGGPRGLSVLERLCAYVRAAPGLGPVTVHLIDPHPSGAGRVWRTDQSRLLLMNTVASQVTVFTDDSVRIEGPIEPGPSLYEWARGLALLGEFDGWDEEVLAEARALGPDDYPTRAFYGRYLRECFERITANVPDGVRVEVHRSRAVSMADVQGLPDGPQGVRLKDGTRLDDLDSVVLALGHLPVRPTGQQARTASLARIHHLTYITPGNPADVDLSGIEARRPVLLRGLGLNFFDHMALLTEGRGGRYEDDGERLVYRASGAEPQLYAFSRRGVPYHCRGRNEKGAAGRYTPRLLTPRAITLMRRDAPSGLRFTADVWPLIAREVETVYYEALLAARGADADGFAARYLRGGPEATALPAEYGIAGHERWSWERITRPCAGRDFADRAAFRGWLLGHLARDVEAAQQGNVGGPLKAALDVLRDLRNEVRLAVDHGGLEGGSHRDELDGWYTPLNAYLSIGPPPSRVRELIALIEAGVVEVLGPGTEVWFDAAAAEFVAASGEVPGPPVRARALIEARLPAPDLRRVDDPLVEHLLHVDQAVPYRIPAADGGYHETGGLAVTQRPYRLIDGRGQAHPRRFSYGVPTESVHWVTAAGTRPGVDSVTLGDSDAIARAVLDLDPARRPGSAGAAPSAEPADLIGVIV